MAARKGILEDLMELGLRLGARSALSLAVLSYIVLHVVSVETAPQALTSHGLTIAATAQRSLIYVLAAFFQYVIPFCLSVGALVCVLRGRRATRLVVEARANPDAALSTMSWRDFERLVGGAFRQRGYTVTETGGNGPDGGIDLLLSKDSRRYLVQCKHWKTWQVGVSIVRELKGVVVTEGAAGGFVVTGGDFTAEARDFARRTEIELIDGKALKKLIGIVPDMIPSIKTGSVAELAPECPKCGTSMVRRVAKQGKHAGHGFWGCGRYPKCSGIVKI